MWYYKLTRRTLELPFNVEGPYLPTSASDTRLTVLLLTARAVSSEGSRHVVLAQRYTHGLAYHWTAGIQPEFSAAREGSAARAVLPYLIEPYSLRSHSVTLGTRSGSCKSASYLPLQLRKIFPKIFTQHYCTVDHSRYRYWFASFKFKCTSTVTS